jgi:hypothetical protein
MTRMRVLHRKVELIALLVEEWRLGRQVSRPECKKIDRSAEALRVNHHPILFPPK